MLESFVGESGSGFQMRETQRAVDVGLLRLFEFDLEGRTPGRGLLGKQLVHGDAESLGERRDVRELRLSLPVLDLGQEWGGPANSLTECCQRQVGEPAVMTEPLAEDQSVHRKDLAS